MDLCLRQRRPAHRGPSITLTFSTGYGYDKNDNRTSQTDANDHTTTFEYDELDRLTAREYHSTGARDFDLRRERQPGDHDRPAGAGDELRLRRPQPRDLEELRWFTPPQRVTTCSRSPPTTIPTATRSRSPRPTTAPRAPGSDHPDLGRLRPAD